MALIKTTETTILAITSVAANVSAAGSLINVAAYYSGLLRIRLGRGSATAFTVGPKVRVEVSPETAPTANDWFVYATFQMAIGVSTASQLFGGSEAAGQTTLTLAAATNFAAGDYVFIHDSTLNQSEWVRVVSVSGNDIVVEEGTIFAHDTADTARDQAEQYVCALDLTAVNSLRVVVDGAGSGQAVICEVIGSFTSGI
jgi:hypothetical protein